jgi:ATP-dependent RNA helicase DDX55/SPB4
MGRGGNALVYLLPSEDSYIEFLGVKQVPIRELPLLPSTLNPLPPLKRDIAADRDFMEKVTLSVTSHLRIVCRHSWHL